MKLILSAFFLLFSISSSISQRINDVEATQFGNNVEVTYTVSDVNANEPYTIQVEYTSKNGSNKALTHTYGDVGTNIMGNGGKKIIWDVLREIDSFEGDYSFKVTLIPSGSKETINATTKNESGEGRLGKFKATVVSARNLDSSVIIKIDLQNTSDNENFKVHVTRSRITASDGTEYLAKSGNQGGKEQYGFMNVVLQKGRKEQIELVFDYVPENISFAKSVEIIRYASLISSESLVISNVKISK